MEKNIKPYLIRFYDAQSSMYITALTEIKAGKKRSHWMWYIFPQIKGLGFSETAQFYAIKNIQEAKDFLEDKTLGAHLRRISETLLELHQDDAINIFGSPDHLKLKSSMTLFAVASEKKDSVFHKVLDKFYGGKMDTKTLTIIETQPD